MRVTFTLGKEHVLVSWLSKAVGGTFQQEHTNTVRSRHPLLFQYSYLTIYSFTVPLLPQPVQVPFKMKTRTRRGVDTHCYFGAII